MPLVYEISRLTLEGKTGVRRTGMLGRPSTPSFGERINHGQRLMSSVTLSLLQGIDELVLEQLHFVSVYVRLLVAL
jgi:hypothetical protein